jgi:hypothetical protein
MNHFEEFCQQFKPLLKASVYQRHQFNRWDSFELIARDLFNRNKELCIVETGTLNSDNDWLGYGQSTLLWDWIIAKTKGSIYSVDIDIEKIRYGRARCKNVNFIHCDSMGFLRGIDASKIDLLYLDSFNWSKEEHISSCLHHMGELAAVWDELPNGCLIAVDDRHNDNDGKHVLVELFFSKILQKQALSKNHLIVWKK